MAFVLITGCSTGIGFATAEVLARQGHTVYATMRNPQRSPELAQLAQRDNLPITILPLDVDSDESVKAATQQILAETGQINVLVNNAGIFTLKAVEETQMEIFRRIMETNYFGALRCMQAILPSMRERKSGLIINISSLAARIYPPFFGAYCATKVALEAVSESLAGEVVEFGIRVAVVEPGVIYTPIIDKVEKEHSTSKTNYPKINRAMAFELSSKENSIPPSGVGEVVSEIISGQRSGFRHPVGLDCEPLLSWRAYLSDEDFIGSAAIDDETWITGMTQLGKNVRPYLKTPATTSALV
ncbi:SDR family oxidoreductase [Adhaeribacter radiodurans]|uniref:SDR family oxidoreductase n=1 Tax=Adhaeribacter radiodurans TaxID=2745197 RepID=A0A7L7L8H6_9BACT|nr:SDR family oxidoreductase [Adhaeribacter radiodurans]QMU29024.1 SDR family oxidoreductase [Adhaeribacter radiodurans]